MAHGHDKAFKGNTEYITILRHPLDRVVSNYYFILSRPQHRLHEQVSKLSLSEYVSSGVTANSENAQIRLLSDNIDAPHGGCTAAMLEIAKENILNNYPIAGVTEMYDEFLIAAAAHFDWKTPFYSRINVNKKRKRIAEIDDEAKRIILEYNSLDLELYEFVKDRFEKQWDQNKSVFEPKLAKFKKRNRLFQKLARIKRKLLN